MTYTRMQHRLGTTAIAAVLALSATPLAAQEVPGTDTPVEATTTAPTAEPAAPVTDPLAPESDVVTPAEGTTAAQQADTTATEGAEAPAPAAKKAATKTARSTPRAAIKSSAPSAAPAGTSAAEAPTEAAPAAPLAAAEPMPEIAPVEQAAAQPGDQPNIDEALPLAGGAGAVILALAGAGMAVRRKRRRDEDGWTDEEELTLTDEVAPVAEPEWDPPVVEPKAAPIPAPMATTEVPDDFDTSKFGRHVQAAYRGPTPENPSLSLRKRLKLAGELDRRERMAGTAPKPAAPTKPVTTTPEKVAFSFSGSASPAKQPEYQF